MNDRQPMQADGQGTGPVTPPANAPGKLNDKGESDGAPYPNPHRGEDDPDFAGGQSDRSYRGGPNPNATTDS